VIVGGPCAVSPGLIVPFLNAVVLVSDEEDAIEEILDTVKLGKQLGLS